MNPTVGPTLFGFAPGEAGRRGLPREVAWRDGVEADLGRPGAAESLWVVHGAAVAEFRAARGERVVPAVVWVPSEGREPPEDWWEDFSAVFREGRATESLTRCANCPAALPAREATGEIANEWFLSLAAPPGADDLAHLPDWFRADHAGVLGDPDGRAEVLCRLHDQFGEVRERLFPTAERLGDWLSGKAKEPLVERLAKVSPLFRSLLREQAEVWLDAGLCERRRLAERLASVGVEPPRPAPWAADVRGLPEAASVWDFAQALVGALVRGGLFRPRLAVDRGVGASGPERTEEAAAVAALRGDWYVDLESGGSRVLTVARDESGEVTLLVPFKERLPNARLLRGEEVVSLSVEPDEDSGDGPKARIVIRAADLRAALGPRGDGTGASMRLEIVF